MKKDTNSRPKQRWSLLRVVLTVVVAGAIFGAGLAVGRGDIHLKGLSAAYGNKSAAPLDYSSVDQVYSYLQKDFDGSLNTTQLVNGAKAGLVQAAGDPYTVYFNPKDAKAFNDQLDGQFSGIGAELGTDSNSSIIVISPISGSPAEKAGLKAQDIIAGVDGQSTSGMSVDAAVTKIRGKAGTKVTLSIIRDNNPPITIEITRAQITIPSVTWKEDGDIGYMKISEFSADTGKLAAKAADEFKAKGVKGVVLDLRGDPGGYLSAAVDVSSLWLDQNQTVVSERRGTTVINTELASGSNVLKGLPTVVLIDGGSASASEITSGALRDNNDATLVGSKSFGKGSVQQVEDLPDGSEVKITIARWYTPNGKNIDKQGITPDVTVAAATSDQAQAGQDPQLDKAKEIIQSKL